MKFFSFALLFLFTATAHAQILGGNSVYNFVNMPQSARISAMGGLNQALMDKDVSLMFQNPAFLNPEMSNIFHFNNSFYLAGTNNMQIALSRDFEKVGTAGFGLQFVNYGDIQGTDMFGNETTTLKPRDMVLTAGMSRPINNIFNYGLNVKYLRSKYDVYKAEALMADFGVAFKDTASGLTGGVVMKNFGTHFKNYVSGNTEPMPFDIQAGVSIRLKHTPFLFSLTLQELTRWDIRYDDPALQTVNTLITDTAAQKPSKHTVDKILRHCVFGVEVYLGKALRINLGFNDLRRQELAFAERKGLSGISAGFQLNLKRFGLAYAYSSYNSAAGTNALSLYIKLDEWIPALKKKA